MTPTSGGAIVSLGTLRIGNSTFDHNYAGNGGALFPRDDTSDTLITSTTFLHNYPTSASDGWGGAMLVWVGAPMTVQGSQFISNTARQGGAKYDVSNTGLFLYVSLFDSNAAIELGGALRIAQGNAALAAAGSYRTASTPAHSCQASRGAARLRTTVM